MRSARRKSKGADPAPTWSGFLEGVRAEHGSVADMLASNGVSDETFEALRDLLLE